MVNLAPETTESSPVASETQMQRIAHAFHDAELVVCSQNGGNRPARRVERPHGLGDGETHCRWSENGCLESHSSIWLASVPLMTVSVIRIYRTRIYALSGTSFT